MPSLFTTIPNASVDKTKLVALGQQISASCGSFTHNSSSATVDVPNLTVSITTTGRPVFMMIISDGLGSTTNVQAFRNNAGQNVEIHWVRDGSSIARGQFGGNFAGATQFISAFGSGFFSFIDTPVAGTYTYKIQARYTAITDSPSFTFSGLRIVVFEL